MTMCHPLISEFDTYLTKSGESVHTIKAYSQDLRGFAFWFEDTVGRDFDPKAVDSMDIQGYRSYLLELNRTPKTINRKLKVLQRFYNWATTHQQLTHNPFAWLQRFVVHEEELAPKWLNRNQQLALIRAVLAKENLRDLAIVHVLLATGLRVNELISLTRDTIELSERQGKLEVQGKGIKTRKVWLEDKRARKALQDYLDQRQDERLEVFLGQRGPLKEQGVERIVAKYAYDARLEGVTPHTLRHSFAQNLIDAGVSETYVAKLMGHSSVDTVKIYTTPTEEDLRRAQRRASGDLLGY